MSIIPKSLIGDNIVENDVQQFVKQATTPASPVVGSVSLYPNADGTFVVQDSDGNESGLGGGGGASTFTLPDPGSLALLDPVVVNSAGAVVKSNIANATEVAHFIVVGLGGGEVVLQSFGPHTTDAPHGLVIGDYYFEGPGATITNVEPTSGVNNTLFYVVSDTQIDITSGTRPFLVEAP